MPRATREFFTQGPVDLAQDLIGQRLVRVLEDGTRLAGLIVETEAYLGVEDKAAHSHGGRRTDRTEPMYGRAGTVYVYFTYGMHHCMNIVCGGLDEPVAVLLRALAPEEGLERMRAHRSVKRRSDKPLADRLLCSGPARICQALAVDRSHNRVDLIRSKSLFLERIQKGPSREELVCTPRIGVGYAEEWADRPLRWMLAGSPHVSSRSSPGSRR